MSLKLSFSISQTGDGKTNNGDNTSKPSSEKVEYTEQIRSRRYVAVVPNLNVLAISNLEAHSTPRQLGRRSGWLPSLAPSGLGGKTMQKIRSYQFATIYSHTFTTISEV